MKEKIIFSLILFLFAANWLIAENKDEAKVINSEITSLERTFGNSFFESLYSIDEIRPYNIIQIDKIAQKYNNSWISPETFTAMLTENDKQYLMKKMVAYITELDNQQEREKLLSKIKFWCIAENQISLITQKIGIGRTNILNIIMNYLPAPVNSNTGEIVTSKNNNGNEEYYYYSILNQLSELTEKEQFNLYSKLFNELAQNF